MHNEKPEYIGGKFLSTPGKCVKKNTSKIGNKSNKKKSQGW